MDIISKDTQKKWEILINDTHEFIDSVTQKKYLSNNETSYEDLIERFFKVLSQCDLDKNITNKIIQLMSDRKFIPAGSILAGLGLTNQKKITLSNCYYIPIEHDSLEGIYEARKRMVKVYSRRGGCGTSFTILRPRNAKVNNASEHSTGAVSFMPGFSQDVYDIGQKGRRGAALGDLDCRHPDLLYFIWCKANPEKVFAVDQYTGDHPNVNYLNISVQITDKFMQAVENDEDWELIFPDMNHEKYDTEWDGDYDTWIRKGYPVEVYETLKARDILKQIAEAAWLTGDPGVLFKDTGQKYSTGYFDPKLLPKGVNPCLPDWAPVLTPNGYTRFKNIENKIVVDNEIFECSNLERTKESADVYKVELESGLCLYCTEDHKIQKVTEEDIQDFELKDLNIGDKVKLNYYRVDQEIDRDEYLIGYDSIHKVDNLIHKTDNLDLFEKSFSFQLGFVHGILERTDSFIITEDHDNFIRKGIHLKYQYIYEQVQLILASINIYSKLQNYQDRFVILDVYDVQTLLDSFVFDESILPKFQEVASDCTPIQQARINRLKQEQSIINITKLEKQYPVYDINVPNKNYFVSSGVVVHNCGEQQLQNFGNCLLAAIPIHKYVINPYSDDAEFDIDHFLQDVPNAVHFLDTMIDINKDLHPLKQQRETDEYGRRIGIEITGLHDMLAMLNLEYGSENANDFIDDIFFSKAIEELKTSIEIAKKKGCAPCFKTQKSRKAFLDQPYIKRLLDNLLRGNRKRITDDIMTYGIRNSAFNTVGPTGSVSLIADNCSSGIEPIYDIEFCRETRLKENKVRIIHLPLAKHIGPKILDLSKDEIQKNYRYIGAHNIDPLKRIKVQSTVQKWTDSSISSTINLKNEASIEDIYNIYYEGWKNQLKGITVFRDGCKKGVLSTGQESKEKKEKKELITGKMIQKHLKSEKDDHGNIQRSYTYIRFWKKTKIYITVVLNKQDKPRAIFASIPYEASIDKNGVYHSELLTEQKSYWDSICRLTSILLRLNVPIEEVIKQLERSSPALTELPNIIKQILKNFIDYDEEKIEKIKNDEDGGEFCPECQKYGLIYQGGCITCVLCAYTKCG